MANNQTNSRHRSRAFARLAGVLVFGVFHLLMVGCQLAAQGGGAAAGVAVGNATWSAEELATANTNCSTAAVAVNPALPKADAVLMCGCIVEEAARRWSYDDYFVHEVSYTDELSKDGTISKCAETAGVGAGKANWTPEEISNARNSCAATAEVVRPDANEIQLKVYCACSIEKASARWSYAEFLSNEYSYTRAMSVDGTLAACSDAAGIEPSTSNSLSPEPTVTPPPVIDRTSPIISFSISPASRLGVGAFSFLVVASEEIGNIYCNLNNVIFSGCDFSGRNAAVTVPSSLQEGSYVLKLLVEDVAGNRSDWLTHEFSIDLTPPIAAWGISPSAVIFSNEASVCSVFSWDASSGAIVEISTDNGAYTRVFTSSKEVCVPHGSHQFKVRVSDDVGNASTIQKSWAITPTISLVASEGYVGYKNNVSNTILSRQFAAADNSTAAATCSGLTWNGISDWALPQKDQLISFSQNAFSGFAALDFSNTQMWTNTWTFTNTECGIGIQVFSVNPFNGVFSRAGIRYEGQATEYRYRSSLHTYYVVCNSPYQTIVYDPQPELVFSCIANLPVE